MLLMFCSDLHGMVPIYKAAAYLVAMRQPSIVLLGGDLLPKHKTGASLISSQRDFISTQLVEILWCMHQTIPDIEIGLMLGNDDCHAVEQELSMIEQCGLAVIISQREWITRNRWRVIGFNYTPESPFSLKDWERLDTIEDKVRHPEVNAFLSSPDALKPVDPTSWLKAQPTIEEELASLPPMVDPSRTVFVSHAPPYGTILDVKYGGEHVGSKAVKRFIEINQPAITFHGHIHESFVETRSYFTTIGASLCVNPGQVHCPLLDAVVLDTDSPSLTIEHSNRNWLPPTKDGIALLEPPHF